MSIEAIFHEMRRATELDFSGYRRELVLDRIKARRDALRIGNNDGYLERLRADEAERQRLAASISINVSSFFRDPLVFEIIARRVLPAIIKRRRARGSRELRVWSAGCAAGEEACSVAILLAEALDRALPRWQVLVFATDIDDGALDRARAGIYRRAALENVRLGILDRYFEVSGDSFAVRPCIREMVRFSRDDLTAARTVAPADSIFGAFDLVLCRNAVIYFEPELQAVVFAKLLRALTPGGYLVLGDSESPDVYTRRRLETVDEGCRIYRRTPGGGR